MSNKNNHKPIGSIGRLLACLTVALTAVVGAISVNAENVALYNDNGEGGVHRTVGRLVVFEGQYYVEMPAVSTYGNQSRRDSLKVYRVRDYASLMLEQPKWAEKYVYAVVEGGGLFQKKTTYYFNMKSKWLPSLTEDMNDPRRIVPIKKLNTYYSDFSGGYNVIKVVLVKTAGSYYLYFGDDVFFSNIESNANPDPNDPAWTRKFKYRARISGNVVYFNVNSRNTL